MVFLNGGWSPFEMSRGIAYEPEMVDDEEFPRQRYRAILDDLPFPVIGVPWYQVRHLPDAVLLGHEVGHTVEDDFRLTKRLKSLLAAGLKKGKMARTGTLPGPRGSARCSPTSTARWPAVPRSRRR